MSSIRSSHFQLCLMFATTLSLSLLLGPVAARAYTADEQQACSGDAFRLCSAEIPDVERVTVCMVRNKSRLSPACRVYFRPDAQEARPAAGRPLSIRPSAHHGGKPHKKPAKKHG
ncbi:hypothetical protein [Bradyrhizobium sp. dw_411]|uniref:hypothetical protein n=1 Tax=Bradyrhizobium sp. dw_411 TaxID=2720082 RepID=UPI00201C206D|nr:hypothetical protein [Bradyrhizobium sp. dw_411]